MKKSCLKSRIIAAVALGCILYFGLWKPSAHADDFTKDFFITSPKYSRFLVYTRQDPPFMMTAPRGWYMAMRRPEAPPSPTGVYFFKHDPEEEGKKGNLTTPYIVIDFFRNEDIASAMDYALQTVAQLKKEGLVILTGAQEFKAGGESGGHFTTKETLTEGEEIIDNYIFVDEYRVVIISVLCKPDEFEGARRAIRQALESIRFSTVLPDEKGK